MPELKYDRSKYDKEYHRNWYANNREKCRARNREYYINNREKIIAKKSTKNNMGAKARVAERRAWLSAHKETYHCAECGISGSGRPEIIDFHHKSPEEKEREFTTLIMCKKERIMEEISKCTPLCANCHRSLHYGREAVTR